MQPPRRLAAQALMAVAAAAALLAWETEESVTGSVTGIGSGEGRAAFVVALITVVLIQIGWRPAWIGAGFVLAVAGRQLLAALVDGSTGDGSARPGIGLWIAAVAALAAAAVLVVDMFTAIDRSAPSPGDDG